MLISPRVLRRLWRVEPDFIVHVGAHLAEEFTAYLAQEWGSKGVVWIEADEDRAAQCRAKVRATPGHSVLTAVLSDVNGEEVTWYSANNGQSSSFLRPAQHVDEYPHIEFSDESRKVTTRFDSLSVDFPDRSRVLVNLDIQGAELHALKGFGAQLNNVEWIYCEVNTAELYEGVPQLGELDEFLGESHFRRVDLAMTRHGWGDALYCRDSRLPRALRARQSLRRLVARVNAALAMITAVGRRVRPRMNHDG